MEKADYIRFPHSPQKNSMIFYVTKHGFSFAVKTGEQAKRLEFKLNSMNYSQVAKFHRELYGATLPKKAPVGKVR